MTAWLNDLRYSANVFRTRPLYAAVIVLVLAVAIGANATVFAVFNGLFLRPLPYPEGDRLVMVYDAYPLIGLDNAGTAIPDYLERRAEARSLKDLAIVRMQARTLTGEGPSERLLVANASASLFDVLRTEPALGRRFTEAETEAGDGRLAVLSHRLWRTRFGAEADIVGRQIRLDDETVRILGVMPEHFGFPSRSIDAWLPFIITPEQRSDAARGVQFSTSVGRLREGATIESLNAELDAIVRRNVAEGRIGADAVDEAGFTGRAAPLRESRVGDLDRMVLVLLASVGAVLLIACANVANLQLARVAGRGRELAIRAVIGAGRMRLVRLVVLESVLLALIGAAVGLLLAHGGLALVRGLGLERDGFELALDGRVVVFTFAAALLAAVVASLPPLLALVGDGAMPTLREAGRHGGGGRRTQLLRDGLVVAQISLGVALLVGAGLLLKSFYLLQQEGTGFDANSVWTAQVSLPRSAAAQRADWASFHQRALETLRALPGATAAAYTSVLPFSGGMDQSSIQIADYAPPPGAPSPHAQHRSIDEHYLPALGIPITMGRNFAALETEPVVIVDENLAAKHWRDGAALGQRLRRIDDDRWYTVVGIVPAVKETSLATAPVKETVYWNYRQRPSRDGAYVVRSSLPPAPLTRAATAAISALDPEVALFDVLPMDTRIGRSLGPERTPMVLTALFAVTALGLAVIGVYAVLNWSVTQRTGDIGVRVALGATADHVARLVLGHGIRLLGIGLVSGLLCAAALGRVLSAQIRDVSATDPMVFAAAAFALACAALAAVWLPARRAARIEPMRALRAD